MDKFNNVLNKLGLRGSSEDDGHRSAQSTPRLSRHRVRESNVRENQRTYGSMGSVENYRVRLNQDWTRDLALGQPVQAPKKKKKKLRSAEVDRVPRLGLDRAWESERLRGMELLHQSVERQRERQRHRDGSGAVGAEATSREPVHHGKGHVKKKRKDKERHRSRSHSHDRLEHYLVDPPYRGPPGFIDPNFRLSQERLERRIDELNKQLLVEKHSSRRDKLTLARLQQEMSRQKSERQLRETLMRELERERMLRMDAEHRLCEVTGEHEASKSRLHSLQEEFQKMEEMVRSMLQYKGKLEALKSEKASLSINYEHSMQKFRTHVGNLEHENKILMAEIKKLESQCANCHLCNKGLISHVTKQSHSTQADGDGDKAKVLLERLKMLEAEKSALVLENEAQRQQYDRCLDQIANQVVQALMSQKTLREECNKLQKRVQDLEAQNKQLTHMFMHKIKFASDSVLQSLACKGLGAATTVTTTTLCTSSSRTASLSAQTQVTFVNGGSPRPAQLVSDKDQSRSMGAFSEVSLESLQSICSDYNEQPQLSSPPAWLRDRISMTSDSPTGSMMSPGIIAEVHGSEVTEHIQKKHPLPHNLDAVSPVGDTTFDGAHQPNVRMPPVGHTSSPSHVVGANGHVGALDGHHGGGAYALEPSIIVHSAPKHFKSPAKSLKGVQAQGDGAGSRTRIETEFPADMTSPKVMHHALEEQDGAGKPAPRGAAMARSPGAKQAPSISTKQDDIIRALTALTGKTQVFHNNICSKKLVSSSKTNDVSPAQELLGLSDAFPEKFTIQNQDGLPRIQNNLYDDSDSDDSYGASQPPSKDFSATSTISLNELLDQGLEDMETPNDDSFSIDDFHCGDTDEEKVDAVECRSEGGPIFGALIKAGQAVMASGADVVVSEYDVSKKSSSSQTSPSLERSTCECEPDDGGNVEDEPLGKAFDRRDVLLNNHSSIVLCKPPLPRPLTRPNSLDLPSPAPRPQQRSESRSCVDYSSSESGSDVEPQPEENRTSSASCKVKIRMIGRTEAEVHSEKAQQEQFTKPSSSKLCDAGHLLAMGHPIKDHGDYVLLKAPGKLAKLTNQDSGVSEPQDGVQGSVTGPSLAPMDGASKHVCVEGSPETGTNQGAVRHQVTSSPDSAMQQSFSSSSSGSDTVLGDKPSFRDDGYSSNSAVSFADGHASRGNHGECLDDTTKRVELRHDDSSKKSVCGVPGAESFTINDDKQRSHPKETTTLMIGKVDGFNPITSTDHEKSSVWTREGICQEMKENYQRRSSLGSMTSNVSDVKTRGLVSEMKTRFERKLAEKSPREGHCASERRYSLPTNRHEEGDYVCLDPSYPSVPQAVLDRGLSSHSNNKELSGILPVPTKPSRPKMGIHAKTRSLMASQRSRSLPRAVMSTYPSDPCLCKKSPTASSKLSELTVQVPKLKRTTSDSCLMQGAKNRTGSVPDASCQPLSSAVFGSSISSRVPQKDVVKEKREKTSMMTVPKLSKSSVSSSSKDKAQCIVGYMISEPMVPEYQLDVKVPRADPAYLRSHSDPQKVYLRSQSDPNQMFIRSQSAPEKGVRVTGEGSEYGYKSGEDPIYTTSRPEVVGADNQPPNTDLCTSEVDEVAFDVREYKQSTPQVQSHVSLNLSLWSSDSDGDSKLNDVQLIPLTMMSPSSDNTSPTHKLSPSSTSIQSPEGSNSNNSNNSSSSSSNNSSSSSSMAPRLDVCDYNLNKKRPLVMSYPPCRMNDADVQCMASYHTLPAEAFHSKPAGDFKRLMENLAKKSEDVLKSRIFHSESCEEKNRANPNYDVILNIGFDDVPLTTEAGVGAKGQRITDITQEIENLTRTMDDLQKSMSSIELEEADSNVNSEPVTNVGMDVSHRNTTLSYCTATNTQKTPSQYFQQTMDGSSSSCDDEAEDCSLDGNMLGDAFVRKFRRRKKKSKFFSYK